VPDLDLDQIPDHRRGFFAQLFGRRVLLQRVSAGSEYKDDLCSAGAAYRAV
jgi:hypothetical protein